MTNTSLILLILFAEASFLLSLALLYLLWQKLRLKRLKKEAVEQLIEQVRSYSEQRSIATKKFLEENYQLTGVELQTAAKSIDAQEAALIQKIIDLFLGNDPTMICSLDAAIAELTVTYRSLQSRVEESVPADTLKEAEEQLKKLEEENKGLVEELEASQKTIDDMVKEYGNMFSGGDGLELATAEPAIDNNPDRKQTSD